MSSHADGPESDVTRRDRSRAAGPRHSGTDFVAVVGAAAERDALIAVGRRLRPAGGLLLDAVGSADSPRTERARYAALRRRRRSLLVVTDRPSAVDDADRIHVVADGVVREAGTHAELTRRRGAYARLYGDQFGQDWLRETADVADE